MDGSISTMPVLRKQSVYDATDMRLESELKAQLAYALQFNGGFIEAFSDYYTEIPLPLARDDAAYPVLPAGLLTLNGETKIWSRDLIPELWRTGNNGSLEPAYLSKRTNLFSIVIFFATVLFFIYYKQNLRFRDNLKRSIRHPYGFFVDMRERRIIPLFNSIIAGGYYSLVLAAFFASFLIYYNDSLQLLEFISTLFQGSGIYELFLKISQSSTYSIIFCFLVFFLYPLVFSITIKILSLFSRSRIRFRQGLAIGFWSGAPFLFMAPVALVAFHLLDMYSVDSYLFYILIFFLLWAHYRIINGIRVLFASKFSKVLIMLLLSYSIPLLIFWAILKPEQYWYEYLKLLLEAKGLY
jgi:hypothetical protein